MAHYKALPARLCLHRPKPGFRLMVYAFEEWQALGPDTGKPDPRTRRIIGLPIASWGPNDLTLGRSLYSGIPYSDVGLSVKFEDVAERVGSSPLTIYRCRHIMRSVNTADNSVWNQLVVYPLIHRASSMPVGLRNIGGLPRHHVLDQLC